MPLAIKLIIAFIIFCVGVPIYMQVQAHIGKRPVTNPSEAQGAMQNTDNSLAGMGDDTNPAMITPLHVNSKQAAATEKQLIANEDNHDRAIAKTLAQKMHVEQIEKDRMLNNLKHTRQRALMLRKQGELDLNALKLYKDLARASSNKQWDNFSNTIDSLDIIDSNALQSALTLAITQNAPIDTIKALVYRGAIFTPEILSLLAHSNNVKLTKQLIPLGLDIHQRDIFHKTGIQNTLEFFNSKQMFDFLLANGVAVNTPDSLGRDALDMALMRLLENYDGLYYATQLLEHGARISTSHRYLLNQLKISNPNAYQALAHSLP